MLRGFERVPTPVLQRCLSGCLSQGFRAGAEGKCGLAAALRWAAHLCKHASSHKALPKRCRCLQVFMAHLIQMRSTNTWSLAGKCSINQTPGCPWLPASGLLVRHLHSLLICICGHPELTCSCALSAFVLVAFLNYQAPATTVTGLPCLKLPLQCQLAC